MNRNRWILLVVFALLVTIWRFPTFFGLLLLLALQDGPLLLIGFAAGWFMKGRRK